MAHDVIFFGCLRNWLDFNQQNPLAKPVNHKGLPYGRRTCQKSGGYTLTARLLRSLAAVLVLFQLPAGLLIADFKSVPLYGLHKSAGVLILILVIIRLAWRSTHPAPDLPANLPALQPLAARGAHWAPLCVIRRTGA